MDFKYFVTRLLEKLSPLRTVFVLKKEQLISDILTVLTNKVFVLFVLVYNKLDCLVQQKDDIDNQGLLGREVVKEKRFCNGRSLKR